MKKGSNWMSRPNFFACACWRTPSPALFPRTQWMGTGRFRKKGQTNGLQTSPAWMTRSTFLSSNTATAFWICSMWSWESERMPIIRSISVKKRLIHLHPKAFNEILRAGSFFLHGSSRLQHPRQFLSLDDSADFSIGGTDAVRFSDRVHQRHANPHPRTGQTENVDLPIDGLRK